MSLDDERVRFYLRHRDQIEEWAGVRPEAALAVTEWLLGMQPELDTLTSDLGTDVRLVSWADDDKDWPGFLLVRHSWPEANAGERPPVSVALEWDRRKTVLTTSNSPVVGVRCPNTLPIGPTVREQVFASRGTRKWSSTPYWPAYRVIPPTMEIPEHLDEYRRALTDALRDAWTNFAAAIDQAIARQSN